MREIKFRAFMSSNQQVLQKELIIDLFAGGGGASTGIEQAAGRAVNGAVNHDPEALGMHEALVTVFLSAQYGNSVGEDLNKPLGTVTSVDKHGLVTSHITKLRGTNIGHGTDEPLHTISAQGTHFGEVRALLVKYYGNDKNGAELKEPMPTITTKDRLGLVTVKIKGEPYVITDIGMRMLQPQELYKAQGFPDDYIFDATAEGKALSKTAQVRMCGNSVCPPIAKALVKANFGGDFQCKKN